MRPLSVKLLLAVLLCISSGNAYCQVRVRHGLHLHLLGNKDRAKKSKPPKRTEPVEAAISNPAEVKPSTLDERFLMKWNKARRLRYEDFKYNRNLYNKFIPNEDSDLLNTIYPDYIAFYDNLKKRRGYGSPVIDAAQDERIEKLLALKEDSVEKGYISSASVDIGGSFGITIDSPAASVISLFPVIYALNDTAYYFNIAPVFNKYESWMIVKSGDILQHEQIHFDIFELFARKMRQRLVETLKKDFSDGSISDITTDITPAYEQLYQQLNKMQLDFDKQTGEMTYANAPLVKTNAAWSKSLKAQLDALGEYEKPEGTIMLK